jgi:hypothetical protein
VVGLLFKPGSDGHAVAAAVADICRELLPRSLKDGPKSVAAGF